MCCYDPTPGAIALDGAIGGLTAFDNAGARPRSVADALLQGSQGVEALQNIGIALVKRYAGLVERRGRRRGCYGWHHRRNNRHQCGSEIPIAIGGRADAILVEAIGISPTNNGLFAFKHIIADQRKCPRVGSAGNINDLDAFNRRGPNATEIDYADPGRAGPGMEFPVMTSRSDGELSPPTGLISGRRHCWYSHRRQ